MEVEARARYTCGMKTPTLVGLLLTILGVVSLVAQGITYTTRENVVDIGPLHAQKETKKTIPLSPVLGGIALVGGIALLVAGSRS
jgi:uncharacterized membrane protein